MMIDLIGASHALRGADVRMDIPAGETLAEMIRRVQPDPAAWGQMRVWIDGHFMQPAFYHMVRPKAGRQVVIKAWVGREILGSLLSIVLTIVAPWAGAALFGAGTIGATLAAAGITLLGQAAIGALIKPPQQGGGGGGIEALPGLRGSRNEARPYGAIPLVLGKHLIAPLVASQPYTENRGEDVYLRQLFVVGYGPLKITDIKIGETPIELFSDYEIEVREGFATDDPITLFPNVAFQEGLSIAVQLDTWNTRVTADNVDEILVDIEWPRGLTWFTSKGEKFYRRHIIQVQYMPVGGMTWVSAPTVNVNEKRLRTIRRTSRVRVPRGQYEVRVRRVADPEYPLADDGITYPEDRFVQDVIWTALRGVRNEDPINIGKPVAKIALVIKATEQLNGVVNELNCIASSVTKDWTGSAWVERETANPAAHYRNLFQGPMVGRVLGDHRLDLPAIQDFAERCAEKGFAINAVITEAERAFDLQRRVLAVGRAAFSMRGGKYSVAQDLPQTVPVQMFNPRNIMSSSFERVYVDLPDALRVQFRSSAAGYADDEVIVYNEGFNAATATRFETLRLWGITDWEQARAAGRYHFRAAKLRPEIAEITTDIEGLIARPGGMVRLAHDALLVGVAQGYITSLTVDGGGNVTAIRLDAECQMIAGDYGVLIRRATSDLEIVRGVVFASGITQDLVLESAIPAATACEVGDLVLFGERGREASDWTVKEMYREEDQVSRLMLVPHAPEIHDTETGVIPEYDPVITLPVEQRKPAAPRIISVETGTIALERIRGRIEPRVLVAVEHSAGAAQPPIARLEAQWRLELSEDWRDEGIRIEGLKRFQLRDVDEDEVCSFRVRAVSEAGRASDWVVQTGVRVLGITEPPANVVNFSAETVGTRSRLTWDAVPGLDISHYIIRHNRLTTGATWANSTTIVARATGTSTMVPTRAGTYLIRAVDTGGRLSVAPAVIVTTLSRIEGINLVQTLIEDPSFGGIYSDTYKDLTLNGVRLAARSGPAATSADLFMSGVYVFLSAINFGGVWTSRVTAEIDVVPADFNTNVHDWSDVHDIPNVHGNQTGEEVEAVLQVRTTNVDPSLNQFGPWTNFALGDYTCWAMRFRIVLSSSVRGLTPVVTRLRVRNDMEERVETFTGSVVAAGQTWTFSRAFFARPVVQMTMLNGASGDRVAITAVTANSAFVRVFNSAGTGVVRNIELTATGYGGQE